MKKYVFWGVIGVIAVALILYFVLNQPKSDDAAKTSVQTPATTTSQKTLKELVAAGRPVRCEFKDTNAQGSVYIADQKVRGDFTAVVDGKAVMSHMISADNTSYIWLDGQTTGFKITVDADQTVADGEANTPSQGIDENKKLDYSCSEWSKDEAVFNAPTTVSFQDFSSLIPKNTNK